MQGIFWRQIVPIAAFATLAAVPAQAEIVADWSDLLTHVGEATSTPDDPFDPASVHSYTQVMLAMFEAANAVTPRYRSYVGLAPAPAGASIDAAVATAAHAVLLKYFPSEAKTIHQAMVMSLRDVPAGQARKDGEVVGRAAAAAAMKAGGIDPALPKIGYMPRARPGQWAPSSFPYDPRMAQARPWFMASASDLRIGPPPALDNAAYATAFNEVKLRGEKASKARTEAETAGAIFWAFYKVDPVMRQIAEQPGRSTVANARMYALVAMASDDLGLVMMDGKMHHGFWRPMNAIRQAAEDGNPATVPDAAWEPLLNTPRQPEYPCGHCSVAATFATILAAEGPVPAGGLRFTSERMKGVTANLPNWDRFMQTVSEARILGGVHFRTTWDASMPAAKKLGTLAMERLAPLN